jgi:hypothetical protein
MDTQIAPDSQKTFIAVLPRPMLLPEILDWVLSQNCRFATEQEADAFVASSKELPPQALRTLPYFRSAKDKGASSYACVTYAGGRKVKPGGYMTPTYEASGHCRWILVRS